MAKSISLAKQCQAMRPRRAAPRTLLLNRYPNLEAAITGKRIEVLVVTLEVGCIGCFQPGRWQPVIPDRVDGAANGRDVVAVGEDRISLLGYPDPAEFARQIGEVSHFDAGDVVEISGIVGVAADTVGHRPDPAGNVLHRLVKTLPLAGNGGAALTGITFADAGDEKRFAGQKTRRLEVVDNG